MNFNKDYLALVLVGLILLSSIFVIKQNFSDIKNKITGAPQLDTSAIIIQINESRCSKDFEQGWNLISVPCVAKPTNVSQVFENISGDIISIFEYPSKRVWRAYNPSLPEWVVQDLEKINRKRGYWLNMDNSAFFELNSSTATPNHINLKQGWNLIGYPTFEYRNISLALQTIDQNYEYIILFNASSNEWQEFSWNTSMGLNQDLKEMVPYYGYWIFMEEGDTLVIDW